jgi:2,4-dienoyl-CoA reductase-like NADH-dependent reductase (Old Yellow Enzyme family)
MAMGRQIFYDPDFPRKIQEGREKEVITCLSRRYCHHLYFQNQPSECAQRGKGFRQARVAVDGKL